MICINRILVFGWHIIGFYGNYFCVAFEGEPPSTKQKETRPSIRFSINSIKVAQRFVLKMLHSDKTETKKKKKLN